MGNVSVPGSVGKSSLFNKIPWTFLIIIYMVVIQATELSMSSVPGYVFLALCVFVLFAEFFKSGDIDTAVFLIDIMASVLSVIVATALMTYLIVGLHQTPTFFHWFGCAIILGDAIISPFNSFRTALRNFGVGS